uniref:3-hydroxyisobutyryl-CoA hydrolase, mitochondrial n=1 Tax=Heligmosomoides polygyrus TaxID=6339 RepID=A0A8L8KC79_HELPZ
LNAFVEANLLQAVREITEGLGASKAGVTDGSKRPKGGKARKRGVSTGPSYRKPLDTLCCSDRWDRNGDVDLVNGRFRVATERTTLAMPETAIGLFPDVGSSCFLAQLQNNLGLYLGLTGYRLSGADAFHIGLATHYVRRCFASFASRLDHYSNTGPFLKAGRSAKKPAIPINIPRFTLEDRLPAIERTFQARSLSLGYLRRTPITLMSVEEILANLGKEDSQWARENLDKLSKMSPTSLKVTFKQFQNAAGGMSLDQALKMEYRLTERTLKDHDFYEGVRARQIMIALRIASNKVYPSCHSTSRSVLVDKDRKPKWIPLNEVKDEHVEQYFAPLDSNQELNTGAAYASLRQFSGDLSYVIDDVVMKRLSHVPIHKRAMLQCRTEIMVRVLRFKRRGVDVVQGIYICDGSQHEANDIIGKSVERGLLSPLKAYENNYVCRTDPRDVARVESKTWMVTPDKYQTVTHTPEGVEPIMGNWMSPDTLALELDSRFPGCMAVCVLTAPSDHIKLAALGRIHLYLRWRIIRHQHKAMDKARTSEDLVQSMKTTERSWESA